MSDTEDAATQATSCEKLLKLVVVGSGTCGKTSLVRHFVHGSMHRDYRQTMGVEFHLKRVTLPGEQNVTAQVWDIGGQTLGGKMLDKYIFGADGVLLVYDISNQNSFDDLEDWLDSVRHAVDPRRTAPHIALVANKCDLEHCRIVKMERHQRFAQLNGFSSHSVSAKTGESVNACFQRVIAEIAGVLLSKTDQEQQQAVVTAEIERERPPDGANHTAISRPYYSNQMRTSVCVLQ